MKYQEIYNGLNKKASNEQIKKLASIIGMRKKAADEKAYPKGKAPAGVGTYNGWAPGKKQVRQPNQYQAQLLKNYGKSFKNTIFPFLPSYEDSRGGLITDRIGRAISQEDLQQYRRRQADRIISGIFDFGTDQYDAAKKYLMSRGAQNQKRYRQGTLEKNAPTEVKMPVNIPESKKQQLDQLGRLMVQNKRPSYSQQIYS